MKKQSEIQAKYDKTHTRRINLKLNLELDADILQKLDSVDSMQGYIKDLIRADLAKKSGHSMCPRNQAKRD